MYFLSVLDNKSIAALCFLAYLLPDARVRADHELLIYFCPVSIHELN